MLTFFCEKFPKFSYFWAMKIPRLLHAAFAAALLTACGGADEAPARLHRIDRDLAAGHAPADTLGQRAVATLFALSGYGESTDSALSAYPSIPSIAAHLSAVDSAFADTRAQEKALGRIAARMPEVLPGVAVPHFFAVISPFNQSVIVADTIVFVGLNHYLGTDYPAYGYFPDFIRGRKVPARLPVDVAEAVVRVNRPFTPSGNPTLLQAMLYEGAVAAAVGRLTGMEAEEAAGFDSAQRGYLASHEDEIWRLMAERQWLYSSDPAVLRGFISLSPATTLLSPDTPGAAGRWVGTRIVGAYLKSHPEASVADLLSPDFYTDPASLRDSGY